MNIFVTGHNGYLGVTIVEKLLADGHSIKGVDTNYYSTAIKSKELSPNSISVINKDIRDISPKDLEGCEAVIHLAALSNDPLGELKPEWTTDINLNASFNLAKSAKAVGVSRFLFSSSCSIYGETGDDIVSEESPLKPKTQYAISKAKFEEYLDKLACPSFSPVFLRNATAYGVAPNFRIDLVINNLTGWAHTTGDIKILSDGSPWRPIVHVRDIASTFAAVINSPRSNTHSMAINVGRDEENYQVKDLALLVKTVYPDCKISITGEKNPDQRSYMVNFDRLNKLFPNLSFSWIAIRGIEQLKSFYTQISLEPEDMINKKYIRIKQLQYLIDSHQLDNNLRWVREG